MMSAALSMSASMIKVPVVVVTSARVLMRSSAWTVRVLNDDPEPKKVTFASSLSAWGASASSYRPAPMLPQLIRAHPDEHVQLWIQIESVQALDAFDAIAQTPGLAGVFFGPADITASLGRLGAMDDPEMEQRVLDAIGKAQTLGVPSGLMTGSERFLGEARKAGATLLGVGADTALLAAALRRHAKTLKGALK